MSPLAFLMAEDDPDERFFMARASPKIGTAAGLGFVDDGEELLH